MPEDLVLQSKAYRPEMDGFTPPGKQYLHVVGTDLVIATPRANFSCWKTTGVRPRG